MGYLLSYFRVFLICIRTKSLFSFHQRKESFIYQQASLLPLTQYGQRLNLSCIISEINKFHDVYPHFSLR